MLDLTESIAPRSDQMNSDDLVSGPRTFTIADVRKGNSAEQPVDYVLAEFPAGRPFRPSKTVRRILVMLWGKDASAHIGRRFTLYRDPNVRFGGQQVGGIRISHMSHIDKPQRLALTETRGKKATHVIEPLPDDAPSATPVDEATVARLADLRAEWSAATPERQAEIKAEVDKLSGGRVVSAPESPLTGESALTQEERDALVSEAFHAFGTHAVSKFVDEYERRIAAAVERIVRDRVDQTLGGVTALLRAHRDDWRAEYDQSCAEGDYGRWDAWHNALTMVEAMR